MPDTPDARPVGETAGIESEIRDHLDRMVEANARSPEAAARFRELLDLYREECAVTARAALLRDAPVVWVAHEDDGTPWICERKPEPEEDDTWTFDGEFDMAEQWLVELLGVPPGTVRRYALVPYPSEEEPA